jgi:flagellar capping protein FliD
MKICKEWREHLNNLEKRMNDMQEEITNHKKIMETQFKNMENFMLQNKMVSSAMCGEVEKLEEIINPRINS